METNNKAIVLEKRIECIIGIFFLIPPILGVISFVLCVWGFDTDFSTMRNLSKNWTGSDGYHLSFREDLMSSGGYMSAVPVYLGMMAFVGAYLIKNSLRYLFTDKQRNN